MRLFAAIPLALLPLAAGAAAPIATVEVIPPSGAAPVPDRCDPIRNVRRTDAPATATARRLDQLPTASLDLAVMRSVNNCPEPVTIREGYGALEGPRTVKRPRAPVRPVTRLLAN